MRGPVGGRLYFIDTAVGDCVMIFVGADGDAHGFIAGDNGQFGGFIERVVLGDFNGDLVEVFVLFDIVGCFNGFDIDRFHFPVGVGLLHEPGIETGGPGLLGVEGVELGFEVFIMQYLEGVIAIDALEKGEIAVVAQAVVDHVNHLAAAVVGEAEECI